MPAYKEAHYVPRSAYRIKEVAPALGISKDALYQQVHAGNVPHVTIGTRLFVPARYFREVGLEEPAPVQLPAGARAGVPEGYTVAEVAASLGAGIPNIYELTAKGVIPQYKEGYRRLIPSEFFSRVGLDAPEIVLLK